jgi:hypothetical protein
LQQVLPQMYWPLVHAMQVVPFTQLPPWAQQTLPQTKPPLGQMHWPLLQLAFAGQM